VLGNTDLPSWGDQLPWETEVEALSLRILVCHIGKSLMGRHDPTAEGFDLVVSGHSHRAAVEWRERTLFLNPGAAGKARFGMPRTLARVTLAPDGRPAPEIVSLDGPQGA
jgi:predicted phosphodiesterase